MVEGGDRPVGTTTTSGTGGKGTGEILNPDPLTEGNTVVDTVEDVDGKPTEEDFFAENQTLIFVAGGAVGLLLLIVIVLMCCRKKRSLGIVSFGDDDEEDSIEM
jgi:hypothetical protein